MAFAVTVGGGGQVAGADEEAADGDDGGRGPCFLNFAREPEEFEDPLLCCQLVKGFTVRVRGGMRKMRLPQGLQNSAARLGARRDRSTLAV